mgnify:CR=1 FL=1
MNAERFWRKVAKSDDCWLWTAAVNGNGYGSVHLNAHSVAWMLTHGTPTPPGKELDHLCRNRRCVRPDHLEAVTQHENLLRGNSPPAINARKKTCPNGHPYTGLSKSGHRWCRPCNRASCKRRRDSL